MTTEIMDAIGTVEKFGEMDFLQREKLAKTLGMSTSEISKSLMLREKMIGLDKTQKEFLDANLDRMGDISGMDQKAVQDRISQLQSTDRLGVAWDKIKAVLVKSLLPIAESFAKTLEDGAPILDVLIGAFKVLGGIITGISYVISGMLYPLKLIGKLVGWIKGLFGETENHVEHVDHSMASLGGISKGVLKTIGGIAAVWFLMPKNIMKSIPVLGKVGSLIGGIKDRIMKMIS